jgi:hypothetical protein
MGIWVVWDNSSRGKSAGSGFSEKAERRERSVNFSSVMERLTPAVLSFS